MTDTVNNLRNKLDYEQVIQSVYDEPSNSLRVNANLSVGGPIEVNIDHTNDSIRLGDGTDFLTSTTSGSKVALDVNDISGSVTTPEIINLNMGLAGVEVSTALPSGTKRYFIRSRVIAELRLGYAANSTNAGPFVTIPKGTNFREEDVELTSGLTLYLQSDSPSHIVEITYWT